MDSNNTYQYQNFRLIAGLVILAGCSFIFVKESTVKKHKETFNQLVNNLNYRHTKSLKQFEHNSNKIIVNSNDSDNLEYTSNKRIIKLKSRPELGLNYHPGLDTFNPHRKYSIIIVNRPNPKDTIAYQINVPISCQAWISIGYGCFVAIINDPSTETNQTQNFQTIINNNLLLKNQVESSSVVLLEIQNTNKTYTKQLSQVSRLFVAEFLKLSMSRDDFKMVEQNSYLITSDVDLYPLSTELYHDVDHDWYLVNPSGNPDRDGHVNRFNRLVLKDGETEKVRNGYIYLALSCIGAYVKMWEDMILISGFDIKTFNSTGIIEFIEKSKDEILSQSPNQKKVDWYMDQIVASRLISRYGNQHGWESVRLRHKGMTNSGRVDRGNLRDNSFDAKIEDSLKTQYRDSHVCRQVFDNACFWKIHDMLKSRLSTYRVKS